MWRGALFSIVLAMGCGYKVARWESAQFQTVTIPPVTGAIPNAQLKVRLRDAMIERLLTGSALKPVPKGQLVLAVEIAEYEEQVLATGTDGRTERLQFAMKINFKLSDEHGKEIWSLKEYPYSDQYSVTTTQLFYRDESVYVQDDAMRSIADLVVTNISLTLSERGAPHE